MTLHEVSAVFLIVGGVLLGPIEGITITDTTFDLEKQEECHRIHDGAYGNVVDGPLGKLTVQYYCDEVYPFIHTENTTAEICTRAMREIGARKKSFRPDNDPDAEWVIKGQPVLCIPAPSGLTR